MEGSFKGYRTSILDASPPCIPYVYVLLLLIIHIITHLLFIHIHSYYYYSGVHLSDLVFIAEGNPKTVGHRINVERLVLESNVMTSIRVLFLIFLILLLLSLLMPKCRSIKGFLTTLFLWTPFNNSFLLSLFWKKKNLLN